jgi:hypothetical protein
MHNQKQRRSSKVTSPQELHLARIKQATDAVIGKYLAEVGSKAISSEQQAFDIKQLTLTAEQNYWGTMYHMAVEIHERDNNKFIPFVKIYGFKEDLYINLYNAVDYLQLSAQEGIPTVTKKLQWLYLYPYSSGSARKSPPAGKIKEDLEEMSRTFFKQLIEKKVTGADEDLCYLIYGQTGCLPPNLLIDEMRNWSLTKFKAYIDYVYVNQVTTSNASPDLNMSLLKILKKAKTPHERLALLPSSHSHSERFISLMNELIGIADQNRVDKQERLKTVKECLDENIALEEPPCEPLLALLETVNAALESIKMPSDLETNGNSIEMTDMSNSNHSNKATSAAGGAATKIGHPFCHFSVKARPTGEALTLITGKN